MAENTTKQQDSELFFHTAVVTGANGFVASAVIKELVSRKINVIALAREGHADNVPKSELVTLVPFELEKIEQDKTRLLRAISAADVFYNFAWAGASGAARADVALQLNNAKWTCDCLRLAKEAGCKRFVNAGSIMETETIRAAFKDENKPGLAYIYGSAKLVAHTMCRSVAADIGIDLLWPMLTNAYGPGEKSPRMVNTTIQKCIRGEPPKFTAGTQNYDFVFIDDVARAFRLIGEKGRPFCDYLIGSSTARPLKEFLLEMKAAVAPDLDFVFGDVPFTGVSLLLEDFDCSKTEADTGFRAEVSFAEGCRRTRDWLEDIDGGGYKQFIVDSGEWKIFHCVSQLNVEFAKASVKLYRAFKKTSVNYLGKAA